MRIIKNALLAVVFVGGLLACSDGVAAPPSSEPVPHSRILDEWGQFEDHYTIHYDVYAAIPRYGWKVIWVYRDGTTVESGTFSTFDSANMHLLRVLFGGYAREGLVEGDVRKVELEPRFEFVSRVDNCVEADRLVRFLESGGYYTDVRVVSEWAGARR